MNDPTHTLVSEATQDRLAHAEFEYKCALAEYLDARTAMARERYAREQGPPDREEDCSDLG
jgi:hypothetical protein